MCSQIGMIFGTTTRSVEEQECLSRYFGWLFTYLLLLNEKCGPHATGAGWLNADGDCRIFKRPLPASELVRDGAFASLLAGLDGRTTWLVGHTRWQTRGDASNNKNNHPLRAGKVVGTANGTILNADDLFERLGLPRCAEVDSELLFRIADATLDQGRLDLNAVRARLALCQGQISAVMASRQDPKKVLVIKGNRPLELKYHDGYDAMVYCTHAGYLDIALAGDDGWRMIRTKPMSLMMFDCDDLPMFFSEPFRLANTTGRSVFQRFTGKERRSR